LTYVYAYPEAVVMISLWWNEARHAARALRRSPTFALTVILTLTVTLGINVGVFTTLYALAAIGVGGLFAYTVVLRRKEIAIRLALGGEPRRIVNAIVREGLLVAAVGAGVGAYSGRCRPDQCSHCCFRSSRAIQW
jgi:ABC-type lipoprotein release transport system permease subunit